MERSQEPSAARSTGKPPCACCVNQYAISNFNIPRHPGAKVRSRRRASLLVKVQKERCFQKIVKNIGLDHTLKTIEKPPYSSYAPEGPKSSPPQERRTGALRQLKQAVS